MENATTEKIEFQHSSTPKKLLSSQCPLLDIPIPIIELILERLPLPDYIRFGSVCIKCHSIQKQHRIRHSPLPPPMQKSFPWLVRFFRMERPKLLHCLVHLFRMERPKLLHCYSPFDQKCFPLSIPKSKDNIVFSASASSHGWFFLIDIDNLKQMSIFNPVSKSQIKFPPLMTYLSFEVRRFLSASPMSSDCVALIMDDGHRRAFLYWLGQKQSKWMSLDIPNEFYYHDFCLNNSSTAVYWKGKFYCMVEKFFVIDSVFTTPTISELNMDCSQFPSDVHNLYQTLVESNGEILKVNLICNYFLDRRFEVFKADFSTMIWARLKSIGDRALFVGTQGSFCVLANDVGCKSNCVYLQDRNVVDRETWRVFDMDIMKWSDDGTHPYKEDGNECICYSEQWFLPSLDYSIIGL